MSGVFLAHDDELERPVAVKLLAGHLASEADFRERFVREAQMAARLSHPNIVQVFDVGEEDERPYIVMEYVPGHALDEELERRGKLEPARAVDVALQICGALEHAHASGLVHRDVKPQNLLMRDDGTVKIADFGIARAAEATKLTEVGSVLGTAAYLAPEQAAGDPVTAAADIYSLGVVVYELLTARTPYSFRTLAELVVKQREEPITPVRELEPDVPVALEAVVMRCLARNPDYRPESAAELADELAAASPEPPTVPRPAASGVHATEVAPASRDGDQWPTPGRALPSRHVARPLRGRRTLVAAVVALAALAIGIAVVAGRNGDGGAPAQGGAQQQPEQAPQRPEISPVAPADNAATQARNLSGWIRQYTEG
jgi:serine/threonine protein kinase